MEYTMVPSYGFKVRLDHKFPEKWSQNIKPKFRQTVEMLPLVGRYLVYYAKIKSKGRPLIMDYLKTQHGKQIYGVPIGGIGSGTIGRGFRGEFCRYALIPGIYRYHVLAGNQFILTVRDTASGKIVYNQVLSTKTKVKHLKSWKWGFDGSKARYTGLYPRSWTEYDIDEVGLKLICRQISPVIPHNYKDSCLPCAVFVWQVENKTSKNFEVSVTFTFQSGTGDKEDSRSEKWTEFFKDGQIQGSLIRQEFRGMPCTYSISSISNGDGQVTGILNFEPKGSGEAVWEKLNTDGKLDSIENWKKSEKTKNLVATAICSTVSVQPNSKKNLEFCLAWDMPKIHFFYKQKDYQRYYTQYFHDVKNRETLALEISLYAFSNYDNWEIEINRWQRNILQDTGLPDWYKSAIFNELYFVSDGGTVWLKPDEEDKTEWKEGDPRLNFGRFAYLEGHEYRMYNTYDVHFYAAFALAQLWPNLESCIQYDFRDSVNIEYPNYWNTLYDGSKQRRKLKGSVPHDIGDPGEEPFKLINAYPIHDVSKWRDLNPKFVLGCYRNYYFTKNLQQLRDFWPTIKQVLEHCLSFDSDGDGLIENGGFPDQTYDCWVMTGSSAYCGGLWLAALQCAVKMAELLDETDDAKHYDEILEKAKTAFQCKLWNGNYYNFDCGKDEKRSRSIMTDQLCGHWLLRACGFFHQVFPENCVNSSLETIFQNNVLKYKNGKEGAVNGFLAPCNSIDYASVQSAEMWTGVAYGLAALFIHEDMPEKGFQIAEGVYKTVYEKIGLGFETPEALLGNKCYRSIGYMRPLSIWGMQHAWELRNGKKNTECKAE